MSSVPRKPTADRRREIVAAVLHILGERGLTALSTTALAKEIGLSTGALFRHFDSREAILRETVRHAEAEIEATYPDSSLAPRARLAAFAAARVKLLRANPGLSWLLRTDQAHLALPGDAAASLQAFVQRSRAYLLDLLEAGRAAGDFRDDLPAKTLLVPVLGTIHALCNPRLGLGPGAEDGPDRVIAALVSLLAPTGEGRVSMLDEPIEPTSTYRREGMITDINSDLSVGRIATEHPLATRVFARHDIDFCCGGGASLQEACAKRGLEADAVLAEIEKELAATETSARRWDDAPLDALIDHILATYHASLREEMPRLDGMARKVLEVHGEKMPAKLSELAAVFAGLKQELEMHMLKEEQILFPAIKQGHGAAVGGPIAVMEAEHESAGAALRRLRELTDGYQVPAEACNTWTALWHGLAAFERDLHEHIHLENNILFPRALAG